MSTIIRIQVKTIFSKLYALSHQHVHYIACIYNCVNHTIPVCYNMYLLNVLYCIYGV